MNNKNFNIEFVCFHIYIYYNVNKSNAHILVNIVYVGIYKIIDQSCSSMDRSPIINMMIHHQSSINQQ